MATIHFSLLCSITSLNDVELLLSNRRSSLQRLVNPPALTPAPPRAQSTPPQPRSQPQQLPAQSTAYGTVASSLLSLLSGMSGTLFGVRSASSFNQPQARSQAVGRTAVPTAAPATMHACSLNGCGQRFVSAAALREHMEGKHGRYMCTQCNRHFGAPAALTAHVQAAHQLGLAA